MQFTEPQPLTDLIDKLDAKTPIGSAMRTAEWERVPQGLRDGAFFSAGVTEVKFLTRQQQAIGEMISRAKETNAKGESMWKMDRGQFVKQLRVMGEELGVKHPTGRDGAIKENDLTDPLSIARLKLVVNTQLELAYGYGQYVAAMDEDILSEWPAWELVRITPRKAPRDWDKRWSEAGGELHDGRMIALKTDPIWSKLSRFGNPHPPFDFNSGMGVEEVDRDTTESLGLMSMSMNEALQDFATLKFQSAEQLKAGRGKFNLAPESQQPGLKPFQEGLEASVKDVPPELRKKLKGVFKAKINIDGDTVQWAQDAPENDDLVKVKDARPEPQPQPEKIPAKKGKKEFAKPSDGFKDGGSKETTPPPMTTDTSIKPRKNGTKEEKKAYYKREQQKLTAKADALAAKDRYDATANKAGIAADLLQQQVTIEVNSLAGSFPSTSTVAELLDETGQPSQRFWKEWRGEDDAYGLMRGPMSFKSQFIEAGFGVKKLDDGRWTITVKGTPVLA